MGSPPTFWPTPLAVKGDCKVDIADDLKHGSLHSFVATPPMKKLLLLAVAFQLVAIRAHAQVAPPSPAAPDAPGAPPPSGPAVCPSIPVAIARARASAENGEAGGQQMLGTYYSEGVIMKQDKVEAYAWFTLAGAKDRAALEQTMTPQQIADGQKRAKQLQAKIDARRKDAEYQSVQPPAVHPAASQ